MSKETTYIDAVTKLKDFINEQDVFIEKVIASNNELAAALQLAKDMMIANDLNLINTFEVIDKALLKVKDWEGDL
jgi:hypothetical protein